MPEPKRNQKIGLSTIIWFAAAAVAIWFIATHLVATGIMLIVILGFSVMIFVHELGHFVVAKLVGIKVEIFSVGFPPPVIGIKRTEQGYRVRLLPFLINREKEQKGEGGLIFTFGGKKKPGETEYQVGLIPFGGFVKMLGQEDFGEAKRSDDPRSYMNKPPHSRLAVIAGGVAFNVISAVIFFMIVFMVGIDYPPPIVGGIAPDYPAAKTSLEAGDEIIEIEGKTKDLDFTDIMLSAALSKWADEIPVKVKHQDGNVEKIYLTTERKPGDSQPLFGIGFPLSLQIGELKPDDADDLKEKTGLVPGDKIISVNNQDVEYHWQMMDIIENTYPEKVSFLAERKSTKDGQTELVETTVDTFLPLSNRRTNELFHICSMVPRLKVDSFELPKTKAQVKISRYFNHLLGKNEKEKQADEYKPDIKPGDIIVKVSDISYPTRDELIKAIEKNEGRELSLTLQREDNDSTIKTLETMVAPQKVGGTVRIGVTFYGDFEHPVIAKTIDTQEEFGSLEIPNGATISKVNGTDISNFFEIAQQLLANDGEEITIDYISPDGIKGSVRFEAQNIKELITAKPVLAVYIPFEILKRTYKAAGPVNAVAMGYRKTVRFLKMTYASFSAMIQGRVNVSENVAGPIGIISMSYTIVAKEPLVNYVYFIGLISVVIAVFNFLPFPPLDGGLAVFLLIEKFKGSPVNPKIQASVAGFGWILIGALLIYVTFNDIAKALSGWF